MEQSWVAMVVTKAETCWEEEDNADAWGQLVVAQGAEGEENCVGAVADGPACQYGPRERELGLRGKRPRREPGRAGLLGPNSRDGERKKSKTPFLFS